MSSHSAVSRTENEVHPFADTNESNAPRLFQYYIQHLAPWYDLNDSKLSFSTIVPKEALESPLLLHAILALSAAHQSRTYENHLTEYAERYHSYCAETLLALRDEDDTVSSGRLLATTCLLRSYEILMYDATLSHHLFGAFSAVSNQPSICGWSEIASSGFWNYLREDISFGLMNQCPLKIKLQGLAVMPNSSVDQDHANSITLILAHTMNACFNGAIDATTWKWIFKMLRDWKSALPSYFGAFSVSRLDSLSSFPAVYHLQDYHAAATHYLLIVQLLLLISAPDEESFTLLTTSDNLMPAVPFINDSDPTHVLAVNVCSIAFTSNRPSVLVNAYGPMSYAGMFLRWPALQEALCVNLLESKKATGWPVEVIITHLKDVWKTKPMYSLSSTP